MTISLAATPEGKRNDLRMIHRVRQITETNAIPYYSFDFPPISVEKTSFSASDMSYIRNFNVPQKSDDALIFA